MTKITAYTDIVSKEAFEKGTGQVIVLTQFPLEDCTHPVEFDKSHITSVEEGVGMEVYYVRTSRKWNNGNGIWSIELNQHDAMGKIRNVKNGTLKNGLEFVKFKAGIDTRYKPCGTTDAYHAFDRNEENHKAMCWYVPSYVKRQAEKMALEAVLAQQEITSDGDNLDVDVTAPMGGGYERDEFQALYPKRETGL